MYITDFQFAEQFLKYFAFVCIKACKNSAPLVILKLVYFSIAWFCCKDIVNIILYFEQINSLL